jgi:hypothetical protein
MLWSESVFNAENIVRSSPKPMGEVCKFLSTVGTF